MKKKFFLSALLVVAAVFFSGCLSLAPDEEIAACPYAGMYSITMKGIDSRTNEYTEVEMTYFEVTSDWKVIGSLDDAGYSGFTGSIDEEGNFFAEPSNFKGAKIFGKIDSEGNLTGGQDFLQYGTADYEGYRL